MKRRVLRSWKCKEGLHQGKKRSATLLERMKGLDVVQGCRWKGCACDCHPWFKKEASLKEVVWSDDWGLRAGS